MSKFEFMNSFDVLSDGEITLRISQKFQGDDELLPFYYYDICVGDTPIGKISIRIGNNYHSYYNGHIGYEIDKQHRGNNYAYKACKLVLQVAKSHGVCELVLTCDESNIASYKTIEKLGTELVEIVKPPENYFAYRENMEKQRIYKLQLSGSNMKITIRKAKLGDEKILAYIQTESWKSAFADIISAEDMERYTDIAKAEAMYENVLKSGHAEVSILEIDGKPHCIVAWSKARNHQFSDCAEIICIHSLCDNWGKGYASMMMNHIIDEIKNSGYNSVLLWVFEKNTRARSFYEKHGFELTDNTRISYDAVEVMYCKELCRI